MNHTVIPNKIILSYFFVCVIAVISFGFMLAGPAKAYSNYVISDDDTGGDCGFIGAWDYASKTCTLTTDITVNGSVVGIEIANDGITLDGAGYLLAGDTSSSSSGVYLNRRTGVTIRNINVTRMTYGIDLRYSNNNFISDNTSASNNFGILLSDSYNNSVTSNDVAANGLEGISLGASSDNSVRSNTSDSNNTGIGISYGSHRNTISGNTVSSNSNDGLWFYGSDGNNTVTDNIVFDNGNGIYLYYGGPYNNTFSGNIIRNNQQAGIYLNYNANGNVFTDNLVMSNKNGIQIFSSYSNAVYNNKFFDNQTQAEVSGGNYNSFFQTAPTGGNYWSDWASPDNNNDGIVDIPYLFAGGRDDLPRTTDEWASFANQALVEKYVPELHFRHDVNSLMRLDFEPRTTGLLLDVPETKLVTQGTEIYNPTLQILGENPALENYLDLPGSPFSVLGGYNVQYLMQLYYHPGEYPITAYTRIDRDAENSGKTVIQYWLLYYYNNSWNNHEGDWEMVEVILDARLEPEAVAYSQHGESRMKYWDEDGLEKNNSHPKVYVAEGSHANYFNDGGWLGLHFTDNGVDFTGDSSNITPLTDLQGLNGSWIDYAGIWGQKRDLWWPPLNDSGPPGPKFQPPNGENGPTPWWQPVSWADPIIKGDNNDIVIEACSPVEIHLYDTQGNHVGKNASGGIDKQMSRSEYFERITDHSKNIVIHNADISGNYRLEIVGAGSGTMDLKIQAPDFGGSVVNKNKYLTVPVTASTKSQLDISTTGNYALEIDSNGDGNYEEQRSPDVSQPLIVDFTPPDQINNLSVTDVSSGTATLSWTSPGDDGNQGTANKFELRYAISPITEESWNYGTPGGPLPEPQAAGTLQTATVQGLAAGTTYYFAIKARDDAWQPSPLSNVVTAATLIPNLTWSMQRVYWASLADYQSRRLSIDYKMSNSGSGSGLETTIQASPCTPNTVYIVSQLPVFAGELDPGANITETLKYFVPSTVNNFITTSYVTCIDDAGQQYWYPGPLP